jgi:hypothetical protein
MASGHKNGNNILKRESYTCRCKYYGQATESGDLQARRQTPCHHAIITEGAETSTWEVCGRLFKNAA